MPRYCELPVAAAQGPSPGTEFGCVWDSVGPPLLPSDVGERFEVYLDTFVAELTARVPAGTAVERDATRNTYRVFLTSPKMQGKRSGLAVDFDLRGNALIIYLRRFLPWSKYWLILPWGMGHRATPAHAAISDILQQAADAALRTTFPLAAPFTWREDVK